MSEVAIRVYRPDDREAVVAVWRAAGLVRPVNDPYRDIDRKLAVDPAGLLVAVDGLEVVGAVMLGYDGHRGWLNYLGVVPECQGKGIGRTLVGAAVEILRSRGCPKVNLHVLRANADVLDFYARLGFHEDPVTSLGLRLIDDEGAGPAG